jgi:hypothetical protein
MRPIRGLATLAVLTVPLLAWSAPAHADNGLLDQAQRMLGNNDNGSDRDRDAYQRGREDEHRRAAAREDRRRYGDREQSDRGAWNDRDRSGWNDRDRAYNPAR